MDPNPDPLVRGTDLQIRIRTKMSRIRNTVLHIQIHVYACVGKYYCCCGVAAGVHVMVGSIVVVVLQLVCVYCR
jgi:hypothetical protein